MKDFSGEGIIDKVGHGTVDAILIRSGEILDPNAPAPALLIAKVTKMSGNKAVPSRTAVIAAIEWAAINGAQIVNLSLGFEDEESDNSKLCGTIKKHSKILFIAAAGNSGPQIRAFPAGCDLPNSMSVGVAAPWSGAGEMTVPASKGTVILKPLGM
jgi:hypothetical protein